MLYIDDGLGVAHTQEFVRAECQMRKGIPRRSRLGHKRGKSRVGDPSKRTWLGLEIDTAAYTLRITDKRIYKILGALGQLITQNSCSPRQMATVAGSIISCKSF